MLVQRYLRWKREGKTIIVELVSPILHIYANAVSQLHDISSRMIKLGIISINKSLTNLKIFFTSPFFPQAKPLFQMTEGLEPEVFDGVRNNRPHKYPSKRIILKYTLSNDGNPAIYFIHIKREFDFHQQRILLCTLISTLFRSLLEDLLFFTSALRSAYYLTIGTRAHFVIGMMIRNSAIFFFTTDEWNNISKQFRK